ncbi:hypothetical protein FBHYGVHD_CDS0025 [Staphylococcus phage MVC_VPHSA1]|uniref:Uncharacterized protein n=1 Tax=Staphylococcus phage MVC_VPHSA1 TaxID=3088876 RepID=A0ABZ0QZX2_9CAUD|nr:hypothetical protein FBHYGVHD_CDS0025 [Staphylococcus phage MVC_VPHSA1]
MYTDLLDSEEAEEQCYEILELAEKSLRKIKHSMEQLPTYL